MPSRKSADAGHGDALRKIITYADKWAGDDDQAFLEVVEREYASIGMGRGLRARRTAAAKKSPMQAAKSFHIFEDPRFLKNARELARRTLGGVRVIGGTTVPAGQFLDCVAVGSDSSWDCTGTLVSANVVVTAGHCNEVATRVFFGGNVKKSGKVVRVKKRVRHPKYHKGKHNDLMVLLLEKPVDSVAPRKIAPKALIDKMTDGRVVGFGNTDPAGYFGYGIKRQVDLPVASPRCAGQVDGRDDAVSYGCDVGLEIVAGRPLLARDSCNGDSGGPFYVLDKQGNWLLAGATSRATDSAVNNCGDGGIYARLDAYRAWIASIPGVKLPS